MADYNLFLEDIYSYVKKENLITPGDRIVVGVSGGADSVSLLVALHELKERMGIEDNGIVAVHINHMIRGDEAFEDQCFVQELCGQLGIECKVFCKDIPAYAEELGITVEEAGRKYRYACFEKVSADMKFTKVAIAHNKNDLVETVIFNMVRGSGLKGLTGISSKRGNIIRPLLFAGRKEIEGYLNTIGQNYRTDSSNLTLDYDRNRIRHVVIPALLEINTGAVEHIVNLSVEAGKSYESIRRHALQKIDINVTGDLDNRRTELNIKELNKLNELELYYIIYEAVSGVAGVRKDITRKNVETIIELLTRGTGKRVELPYDMLARISYDKLIISMGQSKEEKFVQYIEVEGEYVIRQDGILKVRIVETDTFADMPKNNYTKAVDYDKIKGKLCVRNPEDGDYITINENGNSKKLSRIFIDGKIDREKRNSWPVVAVGNEIIWAIGLRYNEAYRVDDSTVRVMCMEYIGKGELHG